MSIFSKLFVNFAAEFLTAYVIISVYQYYVNLIFKSFKINNLY